jgi:hypothetical protein
MQMTIHRVPGAGDVLTPQFFSDKTEIRANMTGRTGTGQLIVELPTADGPGGDAVLREVERILGYNPNQ